MITKVHRVNSLVEAAHFESLGADLVGASVAHDGHFDDERSVSPEFAGEIARRLERAEFVLEPPRGLSDIDLVALAHQIGARWVQIPIFTAPDSAQRAELKRAGIGLILSRVDADYDMDPEWVLGPVDDLGDPCPDLVELELIPSVSESWRFLMEQSPEWPEELQVGDIERLAANRPTLLSVDVSPDNIAEVQRLVPSARGVSLTLGVLANGVSGLHVMSPQEAELLLQHVAQGGH